MDNAEKLIQELDQLEFDYDLRNLLYKIIYMHDRDFEMYVEVKDYVADLEELDTDDDTDD